MIKPSMLDLTTDWSIDECALMVHVTRGRLQLCFVYTLLSNVTQWKVQVTKASFFIMQPTSRAMLAT